MIKYKNYGILLGAATYFVNLEYIYFSYCDKRIELSRATARTFFKDNQEYFIKIYVTNVKR